MRKMCIKYQYASPAVCANARFFFFFFFCFLLFFFFFFCLFFFWGGGKRPVCALIRKCTNYIEYGKLTLYILKRDY